MISLFENNKSHTHSRNLKARDSKPESPQLFIEPFPILLRFPRAASPVSPDGREDSQRRNALVHERNFNFRVLRPVITLVDTLASHV